MQTVFLAGIFDGWELRNHTEEIFKGKIIVAMTSGGTLRLDELAEMTDITYADPENLSLPIGWVVMADLAIQRGEAGRDAVFAALRKHLAGLVRKDKWTYPELSPIDVILNLRPKPQDPR